MTNAPTTKINVKLSAYDIKVLDTTVRNIVATAAKSGAQVVGPVMLPVKKKVWAVNRSPHVYKSSMEHFEMRTHRRLIMIVNPNPQTIELLQGLQVPAGVSVELK
ncbi:MAG: 30S ribosomal protein S10 [Candidatus Dojkabacteria bacterium]|jgi:small subunit ribosomal protein S10|nr:MAG: 30S ribosomal protein S10 [Candidatus Dojkabacteria bacterium]